jgi:uncharacterized protein (DUF305 family)
MKNFLGISLLVGAFSISGSALAEMTYKKSVHKTMDQGTAHDPHFLDQMTEHHKDGIKMADMALQKAQSKEIKAMADKMAKDHKRELKQMQDWRKKNYSSIEEAKVMPSKMDMSKLENSEGDEFDKKFAGMMARHHEDGIKMAQEAMPMLQNKQIKQFAENMTKNQTMEMKQLQKLQSSLETKTSTGTGTSEESEE